MNGKAVKSFQKSPDRDGKGSSPGSTAGEKSADGGDAGSMNGNAAASVPPQDETMKQLLEEAHRMLKSMSVKEEEKTSGKGPDRVDVLQKQLDDLKRASLRVFRLTRMEKKSTGWSLLDSGATHPLRPPHKHEDPEKMVEVEVTLAGGQDVKMKLSMGGSIVGDVNSEVIVPLGLLTGMLQCGLSWTPGGVRLFHPAKGAIEVTIKEGCPMIATKKALELIEIEERTLGKAQIAKFQAQEMSWKKEWIHRIAEEHPAFQGLPQRIKDALKEDPSESLIPLANRRKRKFWRSNGVVIHAFAGEKDG